MLRKLPRSNSRINLLRPLASLLLAVLSFAALAAAQSVPFPTYQVGANQNGSQGPDYPSTLASPWVLGSGQIITPAGTQVYLGIRTRAKAVALNPNASTHTAAVLQMGAPQAVSVFNTQTGAVLQAYKPFGSKSGSHNGIAYTSDGKYLLFSEDNSYVAVASVDPITGLLSDYAHVSVPINATLVNVPGYGSVDLLNTVTCFPNSPPGTTGSSPVPCGIPISQGTSYPLGIAISPDNKTAYAVLDTNNTLAKIDLTTTPPTKVAEIRVGNVPHSVVISPDGQTAYVSNEAGRIATANDFQEYSNGTPVVAQHPTGSTSSGTLSVVDLATFTVTGSIETGLHPTGMAFWGKHLLVANAYDDTISVIDTERNEEERKINLGLPVAVPGEWESAYGAGPNSITVDAAKKVAYVALYNANAIAVVDLREKEWNPVVGMIPVGYAPSSVVLDAADDALLVANDKGLGATGYGVLPPPTSSAENSYETDYGVSDHNTHQDLGTVSIVPVPTIADLAGMTAKVFENNHWDLVQNIVAAFGGNRHARPVAIPANLGSPSLIKHVFVIIRENRTYDQILGDVVGGNGDPSLAVFGDNLSYVYTSGASGDTSNNIGTTPALAVTPNAHALVQRFPLLDNFYDPSRQSADGHNWITQAIAPYSDDIQSPDWLRDYPSNGGDALAYQKVGHLWDQAAKAGVSFKNYGEYIEYNTFTVPGCTPGSTYSGIPLPFILSNSCEPSWTAFYNDTLLYENESEPQLQYFNIIGSVSPLPNLINNTVPNYPQFDLGIPDQYRVDVWKQDFANDLRHGTVPQLEFMWISSDHTGGPPTAQAMQADNDLALGRFVEIISNSPIWSSSAIFVEEDDAQTGVDHVDGHRSPGYIISPYVNQVPQPNTSNPPAILEESHFYTQVNMTRTIEQILGIPPMNQNDLVASPMRTLFTNNPPRANFAPWSHVPSQVPLCQAVPSYLDPNGNPCPASVVNASPAVKALQDAWQQKKSEIFAGKYHTPDSEDPDTVRHYDWYDATGYKVPFPGEKTVRPPSDFSKDAPAKVDDDD